MLNTIRTYSRRGNVKLLGVVPLSAFALGALGGTAIAGGSGKAPKASKAAKAMPRANRSPRTAAISQMASAYPVLGRAQQTADVPPTADQSQWVISQGGTPANTRLALVTPNGQSIYLVPANGELCVESAFMAGCRQCPSTTPQRLITVGTTLCSPALPSNEVEGVGTMPPPAPPTSRCSTPMAPPQRSRRPTGSSPSRRHARAASQRDQLDRGKQPEK